MAASKQPAIEVPVGEPCRASLQPRPGVLPGTGATKLDLVNYYLSVGDGIVNALARAAVHVASLPDRV